MSTCPSTPSFLSKTLICLSIMIYDIILSIYNNDNFNKINFKKSNWLYCDYMVPIHKWMHHIIIIQIWLKTTSVKA